MSQLSEASETGSVVKREVCVCVCVCVCVFGRQESELPIAQPRKCCACLFLRRRRRIPLAGASYRHCCWLFRCPFSVA
jgi:hypothetical protein